MPGDDWQRAVLGEVGAPPGAAGEGAPAYGVSPPVAAAGPSGAAPAVQPPAPAPALPAEAAALVAGKARRGDSATRRAVRSLRRLAASSASRDTEQVTGSARALQQPITTGRQIVVTSVRGGAGKTAIAALLGSAYAHYRPDPVLVMEANPALGTLPVRLAAPAVRWTMSDVAEVLSPSMRFDQVIGYLVGLPGGGWLLPGSRGQVGAHLTLRDYQTVAVALRRYFAVTVVDCETLPGELARSAMAGAQARVLVAPATVEGVASTRAVLDWMANVPRPMLAGAVVALNATAPDVAIDLAAAQRYLQAEGVSVVTVPYDRHLAAGGQIRLPLLGEDTHDAVVRLAAELLNQAVRG